MEIKVPEPEDVLASIADVRTRDGGVTRTIAEWRQVYRDRVAAAMQAPPLGIFLQFVNSLLERAMPAESWHRRMKAFREYFASFEDITDPSVKEVLGTTGYRFRTDGPGVVMEAKRIVTAAGFTWAKYVGRAEQRYESDFQDDEFLRIHGVGFKTRDLAVSELSNRFAALDLHVVRVTARTGLLLHAMVTRRSRQT